MDFRTSYSWVNAAGVARTFTPGASAVTAQAGLGVLVASAARADGAGPYDVGEAVVEALSGPRSRWPAPRGRSANYGPHSKVGGPNSIDAFGIRQTRDQAGRLGRVTIINDADRDGVPYAAFVDEGIGRGGRPVSPARYAANRRAVEQTYRDQEAAILRRAAQIASQRRDRP